VNEVVVHRGSYDHKVSIVINCHNGAHFLESAIDSVLKQTFTDWLIIFVDNASTDESARLAAQLTPRIRVVKISDKVKLGAARNIAIDNCDGEIIAFLDVDDLWDCEKLSLMIEKFDDPEVALVVSDGEVFGDEIETTIVRASSDSAGTISVSDMLENYSLILSSAMIRRSSLESIKPPFNEDLEICEETQLFLQLAESFRVISVNTNLVSVRKHQNNLSGKNPTELLAELEIMLESIENTLPGFNSKYKKNIDLLMRRNRLVIAGQLASAGSFSAAKSVIVNYLTDPITILVYVVLCVLPKSIIRFLLSNKLRRGYNRLIR